MSPPAPRRSVPLWLPVLAAVAFVVGLGVPVARYVRKRLWASQRPTVSEVKSHLKSLYTAERAYLLEHDVYDEDMARVGFWPEWENRYTYFSAATGRVLPKAEREHPSSPFQVAPADPSGPDYRGAFNTFADTGCPVTPVTLSTGGTAGLGVTPADGSRGPIFIAAAAANIDDDATVDCWSIASEERRDADGNPIAAGVPYNEVNDVVR
jgi:type IV pilus assembly protein PilA